MEPARLDPTNPDHQHIAERLQSDLIVWFATVRPDGRPHQVAVWFLWESETILIFSKPNQKVRNLRAQPAVSLGLDGTNIGDDVVTIEGVAELLPDGVVTSELPAYAAKYAERLANMGWTAAHMAQSYTQAIRITPTKFTLIQ